MIKLLFKILKIGFFLSLVLLVVFWIAGGQILKKHLHVTPTKDWRAARTAIVLGFGYGLDGYQLTSQSFRMMRLDGVPESIQAKLMPLENKHYTDQEAFLKEVRMQIGPEQNGAPYAPVLLAHAQKMDPLQVNLDLLRWTLRQPRITTILAQEAVFVAPEILRAFQEVNSVEVIQTDPEEVKLIRKKDGTVVRMVRLHRHHPGVYVNTLNALAMGARRFACLTESHKVLLVAHDLQLLRAVDCWYMAKQRNPEAFTRLELAVPALNKQFPGTWGLKHPWTANRGIYALWEFLGIPRMFGGMASLAPEEIAKVRIPPCVSLERRG